jgi:hypothetical protein
MLGLSWEEQCNITFFDTEGMFLLERLTLRDGDRIVVGQVCCPSAICKGDTLFKRRMVLFLHGCTPYLFKNASFIRTLHPCSIPSSLYITISNSLYHIFIRSKDTKQVMLLLRFSTFKPVMSLFRILTLSNGISVT